MVLGLTLVAAIFAPWLAPYDPVKAKPWDSLQAPSSKYWLGADRLGRDQLSRLIYGAQVSLSIGVGGVGIAVLLGMLIGVTAGWYGGMRDEILMRLMDELSALLEAALSFLGVGVKPPTPAWGGMLRHAFETMAQAPWLTVSPGVAIFLVVLAFNFFGDALRDVLDPKLHGTR